MDYNKLTKKIETLFEKTNSLLNAGQIIKARHALNCLDENIAKLKKLSEKSKYLTESYAIYEERFKNLCDIFSEKVKDDSYEFSS